MRNLYQAELSQNSALRAARSRVEAMRSQPANRHSIVEPWKKDYPPILRDSTGHVCVGPHVSTGEGGRSRWRHRQS
jgi:hypothetical protein